MLMKYICYINIYLMIIVLAREKWLAIFNCNLCNASNSNKHITVHRDIAAKRDVQNLPLLEAFVDCFLAIGAAASHLPPLLLECHHSRATNIHWCLANVPIISLNSFVIFQMGQQPSTEDLKIIKKSRLMRA